MSGSPIGIRLQPGEVHPLHPTSHRVAKDAIVTDPGVIKPSALRLQGSTPTGTSERLEVIDAWKTAGLKFSMPMSLIAKRNNEVRPIIDYSRWTNYMVYTSFLS